MVDLNCVHMGPADDYEPFLAIAQRARIVYYVQHYGAGVGPGVPAKEAWERRGAVARHSYGGALYFGGKSEIYLRMERPAFEGDAASICREAGIRDDDPLAPAVRATVEARLRGHLTDWSNEEMGYLNRVWDALLVARKPKTAQALARTADMALAYKARPSILRYREWNGYGRGEEAVEREFYACQRMFNHLAAALSLEDMAALEEAHKELCAE